MEISERKRRWRLLLGRAAENTAELSGADAVIDASLAALYEQTGRFSYEGASDSEASGLPEVSQWMSDIRANFPSEIINVIQNDAIERREIEKLVLEPEALLAAEPNVSFAAALLKMNAKIPETSRAIARRIVWQAADEIRRRLESEMRSAVTCAVRKRIRGTVSNSASIDWHTTIRKNLSHYDSKRRVLLPERFSFLERGRSHLPWNIIVMLDHSASMADSALYAAVTASVLASIPAIRTRVIAFGTHVSDVTDRCDDPAELLLSLSFSGGTDIGKALTFCAGQIDDPTRTMILLVSDLFEGGDESVLLRQTIALAEQGVTLVCLTAINDSGLSRYDGSVAKKLASAGAHCVAATPEGLPLILETLLGGQRLKTGEGVELVV